MNGRWCRSARDCVRTREITASGVRLAPDKGAASVSGVFYRLHAFPAWTGDPGGPFVRNCDPYSAALTGINPTMPLRNWTRSQSLLIAVTLTNFRRCTAPTTGLVSSGCA